MSTDCNHRWYHGPGMMLDLQTSARQSLRTLFCFAAMWFIFVQHRCRPCLLIMSFVLGCVESVSHPTHTPKKQSFLEMRKVGVCCGCFYCCDPNRCDILFCRDYVNPYIPVAPAGIDPSLAVGITNPGGPNPMEGNVLLCSVRAALQCVNKPPDSLA